MKTPSCQWMFVRLAAATVLVATVGVHSLAQGPPSADFPPGTATPSEVCGACHQAIYREFATGFGTDLRYRATLYRSPEGNRLLGLPANVSASGTAHAVATTDPFPAHARMVEEEGRSCNVCHFPQPFEIPDLDQAESAQPIARPKTRRPAD